MGPFLIEDPNMFHLGKGSLAELRNPNQDLYVHPDLCMIVEEAITITPVDFSVHDGLRTFTEQKEYVRTGVSKTLRSFHIPNIPRSQGLTTEFGQAVDLVPYINGKLRWEWEAIYQIIAAVHQAEAELLKASANRLRWGGVWDRQLQALDPNNLEAERNAYIERRRQAGRKAFTDGPHIQLEVFAL